MENVIDMHNRISPEDLSSILKLQLETIFTNPKLSKAIPPMMIWGAPGIGKSTIIRAIADELNINFIDIRLAQREPVDIRGLPVPDKDSVKWLISADWPRDPNSKGIILFDELTAADRSLQVAAYELILDRRLGELYKIPDNWYIIGAGNRIEDSAVSMTMSSALANRFMHFELNESVDDWIKWGYNNNINYNILAFIRYRPNFLLKQNGENLERGWPSPRSWERVSYMLDIAKDMPKNLISKIVYGLIGNQAGVEFISFLSISEELTNVKELLLSEKTKITLPEKIDRLYALCSAVAYYIRSSTDVEELELLIGGFFRIAIALSSDFSSMLMMDVISANNHIANAIFNHKMYKTWADKHGKALRSRMNRKELV